MAIYLLATCHDDKDEYLANANCIFFFQGLYSTIVRLSKGLLPQDLYPMILVSLIAIIAGRLLGGAIVKRIEIGLLKKLAFITMIAAGIATFLSQI